MQAIELNKALNTWPQMAEMLYVPHGEEEYQRLVNFLDKLIDEVGENESHPLTSLMEIVGTLIERYEDEHVPELAAAWNAFNEQHGGFADEYSTL